MKNLEVKFSSDGSVLQNVAFAIMQSGRVLAEGAVSGKISSTFKRTYRVEADESHIDLLLHNIKDPSLTVTASLS